MFDFPSCGKKNPLQNGLMIFVQLHEYSRAGDPEGGTHHGVSYSRQTGSVELRRQERKVSLTPRLHIMISNPSENTHPRVTGDDLLLGHSKKKKKKFSVGVNFTNFVEVFYSVCFCSVTQRRLWGFEQPSAEFCLREQQNVRGWEGQ